MDKYLESLIKVAGNNALSTPLLIDSGKLGIAPLLLVSKYLLTASTGEIIKQCSVIVYTNERSFE